MKRYILLLSGIIAFILISFFLANALNIPWLQDPTYILQRGGFAAAVISVALLVSDVVLPIPSSVIMIANGAIYGIALGASLSLVGGILASLAGLYLGKKGAKYINRFIPAAQQEKAKSLMKQWGLIALIVTRPIPVLSETLSVMAGTTDVKWWQMLLASILGLLPAAIIYAVTGAYAMNTENNVLGFLLVIGIAAIFWFARKLIKPKIK